jgi:SPP1 gp7 family putative phage head morphogenesis protein
MTSLARALLSPKRGVAARGQGLVRQPQIATQYTTGYHQIGGSMIPEWDAETAVKQAYLANVFVYACVQLYADTIASIPLRVGKNPEEPQNFNPEAPLARLLGPPPGSPNPDTTPSQLWAHSVASRMITGRFGWELEWSGKPGKSELVAIWPLIAQYLEAIPPPAGTQSNKFFTSFAYNANGQRKTFGPEEIYYDWQPSQHSWHQPESALQAARVNISGAIMQDVYDWAFLKNDARPAAIVITEQFDSDNSRKRFRDQFNAKFGGPVNAGKAIFTEKQEDSEGKVSELIDIKTLGLSQKDSMAVDRYSSNIKSICVGLGVPLSKLDASGRCLRASEFVRLANGERHQAKDLVGKNFTLLTSSSEGQIEVPAWATWEQIEPIYKITTESGRTLETNGRHPLFAANYTTAKAAGRPNGPRIDQLGWTAVGELQPGQLVAVPARFEQRAANALTDEEAAVLGYLIGDGSISGSFIALTTPDGEMVKDFRRCIEAMGDVVTQYTTTNRVDSWGVKATSLKGAHGGRDTCATRRLLRATGLMGHTSRTKFIPSQVFAASRSAQAAFIGALLATDGCISTGKAYKKAPGGITCVSLVTVSERLALDFQELLLRLGVSSKIRFRTGLKGGLPSMAGQTFSAYAVDINAASEVLQLLSQVEVPGKQRQCLIAIADCERKLTKTTKGGNVHTWRIRDLDPGLRWEKVKSVEPVGVDQTVGIAVPEHHTYLSTFYEHNTFSNEEGEDRTWWKTKVIPRLTNLQEAINVRLAPMLGDELCWFDLSDVEVLKEAKKYTPADVLMAWDKGVVKLDEAREMGFDLDPLENGEGEVLITDKTEEEEQLALEATAQLALNPAPEKEIVDAEVVEDEDDQEAENKKKSTKDKAQSDRSAKAQDLFPESSLSTVHQGLQPEGAARTAPAPVPVANLRQANSTHSNGVMVAFMLTPEQRASLAVEGYQPPETLHCTLAYLGKVTDDIDRAVVARVVEDFAAAHDPIIGTIGGKGIFATPDGLAVVALVDAPGLSAFRLELVAALEGVGVEISKLHDFTPHITLGYADTNTEANAIEVPVGISVGWQELSFVWGGEPVAFPLGVEAERQREAEARAKKWRAIDTQVSALEASWERTFRALFMRQQDTVLSRLEGKRGRQAQKKLERADEIEIGIGSLFDVNFWTLETAQQALSLYETVIAVAGGRVAADFDIEFSIQAPFVQDLISERANKLAGQVTDTTYKRITEQLTEGVAQGETIEQLADRVQRVFEDASRNRALTIARTESMSTFNQASYMAAVEYGEGIIGGHEWLAADDTRTRDSHEDADGQLRSLFEPFDINNWSMFFPGDGTEAPPSELVNCRCAHGLISAEDWAKRRSEQQWRNVKEVEDELIRLALEGAKS